MAQEPPPLEGLLETCLPELLRLLIQHHLGPLLDQLLCPLQSFHQAPCLVPVLLGIRPPELLQEQDTRSVFVSSRIEILIAETNLIPVLEREMSRT